MSRNTDMKKLARARRGAGGAVFFFLMAMAPLGASAEEAAAARDASVLSAWWNGAEATGNWFGVRDRAEENGLVLTSQWHGIYFGVVASENGPGDAFSQEWAFGARWDLAKLSRWKTLDGLTAFGSARWREPGSGSRPNDLVGASSLFNPSRYVGGSGWRMLDFGLTYVAPVWPGREDFLTLTAGWLRPQREFIGQPSARLFANNAMSSARGVGGNIPFSSSYSAWGGVVEINPSARYYAKAGLYMTYPEPTDPGNNGLMFRGVPFENGLFAIGEAGFTPVVGAAELPGKYVLGGYCYGGGGDGGNQYGFYGQADQMLFRAGGGASGRGLRMFSLATAAPEYNNTYPFYIQGGLVYEGLIPPRGRDQVMAAVAFGKYSAATRPGHGSTTLVEAGYRIRVNGWSFIQPFAQYIVRPDGSASVADAAILGAFLGMDF